MNGAAANILIAKPRSRAGKQSAITPPAFVSGEDPNAPEKNLRMMTVHIFWEPATPALKKTKHPKVKKKRICRPNNSLRGAQKSGPMAKPKTNRERPRVTTMGLTWKATISSGTPMMNVS
jgi:hypothetical protein